MEAADRMLRYICTPNTPPPQTTSEPGGRGKIEWHTNQYDLEIEMFGHCDAVARRYDKKTGQDQSIAVQTNFYSFAEKIVAQPDVIKLKKWIRCLNNITCIMKDHQPIPGSEQRYRLCLTRCLEYRNKCHCDFLDDFQYSANPQNNVIIGPTCRIHDHMGNIVPWPEFEAVLREWEPAIFKRLTDQCQKREQQHHKEMNDEHQG